MNTQHLSTSSSALTSKFGRHLSTLVKRAAWAVIPAICLIAIPSSASAATTTGGVDWITFPDIRVASNGTEYTGVVGSSPSWEARFQINAGGVARVKNWTIYPMLDIYGIAGFDGIGELNLAEYKKSKSYSFGQRPKNVDRTEGRSMPKSAVENFAVAVCNRNLTNLMGQGQTRASVLGTDRGVAARVRPIFGFTPTIGDTLQEVPGDRYIDIECEKTPFEPLPPGPGGIQADTEFILDNSQLDVTPDVWEGQCPKDLTLEMEVQGSGGGTFEAWVESTDGWQSTKINLGTNEFDESSGLWGRQFSEDFTLPVEYPTGGGGAVPPGPGNKVQTPGNDDGGTPTGGLQGAGGLAPTDPGWNVHQASLRLVARANGKTVKSDWHQYRVTCEPKVVIPTGSNDILPGIGDGGDKPDFEPDSKPDAEPKPKPKPKAKKSKAKFGSKTKSKPAVSTTGRNTTRVGKPTPAKPSTGQGTGKGKGKGSNKPTLDPKPKPTPKPKPSTSAGQGSKAGKPDLQVLQARPSKRHGAIEFLVRNGGNAGASKSAAKVSCGGRGAQSWEATLPALAAGAKQWVVSSNPSRKRLGAARSGSCTILLDHKNTVDETNERNNSHSCKDCQVGR